MNRAVFLDRDGTIIEERNYLRPCGGCGDLPRSGRRAGRLHKAGFKLFIVSNQSGVGRGYFTLADVEKVECVSAPGTGAAAGLASRRFTSRLRHPTPQAVAASRRRSSFLDARDEFGVDLARSYMIGDKPN